MNILITGAAGFVGPYLADHWRTDCRKGEIWGLVWEGDPAPPPDSVRPVTGDITDPASIRAVIQKCRPEVVFHLAAASSVTTSWNEPALVERVNVGGSRNLFDAVRQVGDDPLIIVASSAEVYGSVPLADQPITELTPLHPQSPYAQSKAAQEALAHHYGAESGLRIIRLRLFPHTGPGRPPQFVASNFARQLARIERGLEPPVLSVGNLEAVRDFTDVRDVARAYLSTAVNGVAGEVYNVCSGRGLSIGSLLELLLELTDAEVEIEVDPDRLRAADIPHLVGDHSRLTAATGWDPQIPFERTLRDLLEWWRAELDDPRK